MPTETVVDRAFKARGYKTFGDYLAEHSGSTLREMAVDLSLKEPTFILYHSRWIDAQAAAGKVAPLRLED